MNDKTFLYIKRLKEKYSKFRDNDSLLLLAEAEKFDDRARELKIYREQEKTQQLIKTALERYRICIHKLISPDSKDMTDEEHAYCLASMDWCKYTLDIVGESPEAFERTTEELVEGYARKAGIV